MDILLSCSVMSSPCNPVNCSPPGSVHGILQTRILEWFAVSFSKGSSWPRDWIVYDWQVDGRADSLPLSHQGRPWSCLTRARVLSRFSCVQLCATLWTAACQAPLSMGFSVKNTEVGCHALLQGIVTRDQSCVPYVSCIGRWVLYY